MFTASSLLPRDLARTVCQYVALTIGYVWCLTGSVLYIKKSRPPIDYKKYLGPDWKPSYENPSTVICNHSTYMDTPIMMTMYSPSFIAKDAVRKIPGVGYMAGLLGTLFVKRMSKDDRKAMALQIQEH